MNYLANIVLFAVALFLNFCTLAGQTHDCGFDESLSRHNSFSEFEQKYQRLIKSKDSLEIEEGMFANLPIVFHIVHEGDSLGSVSNPRIEDVRSIINVTNDYFRQHNTQQNTFENPFYGADTEISFCLASRDEDGNPSFGITRHFATDVSVPFLTSLAWDKERYINVFLLNKFSEDFCGLYTSGSDIIRLDNRCLSQTLLAHELGHYLGLSHVFGIEGDCSNSDCTLNGDRVCDTPPARNAIPLGMDGYENQLCDFPGNSCNNDGEDTSSINPYRSISLGGLGDQPDPNINIMSYASGCNNNFTQGQALRMQLSLMENRQALWGQALTCATDGILMNDASIDKVNVEDFGECNSERVITVELKNLGQEVLTSATIVLMHQNEYVGSFVWEGALQTGQSEEVGLGQIVAKIGRNIVEIKVQNPNNKVDQGASSDFNYAQFFHFDTEIFISFFLQDVTVCDQDSIRIGVLENEDLLDLNFLWRRENGTISESHDQSPSLTITESDRYFLTVYTEDFSCAIAFEGLVIFADKQLETPLRINAEKLTLDCGPDGITLLATNYPAAANINWYFGDEHIGSGESIQVFEKGEYRFEAVYETQQCMELKTFSHWMLVEGDNSNIEFSLEQSDFITCDDNPVFFFPTEGYEDLSRYSYHWKFIPSFFSSDGFIDINPEQHPLFFENENPTKIRAKFKGRYLLEIRDKFTKCSYETEKVPISFQDVFAYFTRFPFSLYDPFHYDNSYQIAGIFASNGPEFEYSWTSEGGNVLEGASTLTPIIKGYGIYTLSVTNTNTGCAIKLVMPLIPDFTIQRDGNCIFEESSDAQEPGVEVSLPDNDFFDLSIKWYNSSGELLGSGRQINLFEPGEYHVQIKDGTFSTVKYFSIANDYFAIPQSIINSIDPIYCPLEEVLLDGRNSIGLEKSHFEWNEENGAFISDSILLQVDLPGIYSLRIQNLINGCFSISDIDVQSSAILADAGKYQVLDCLAEEVQLGQNATEKNYEYIWTKLVDGESILVDTAAVISVSQPGTYRLEAKNIVEECSSLDQVKVYNKEAFINIDIIGTDTFCEDSTALLSLENLASLYSYDLIWTFPDSSESSMPLIRASEEGQYVVHYLDLETGCEYFDTLNLQHTFSVALLVDTMSNSVSAQLTGGIGPFSYSWSTGAQGEIIHDLEQGEDYIVTVTDATGCTSVEHITYVLTTYTDATPRQKEVLIYPNPSSGELTIQFAKEVVPVSTFTIYNSFGEEVFYNKLSESSQEIKIDMQSNPAGVYILKIDFESEVILQKIALVR